VLKRVNIGVAGAGVFGGHHASKYAIHDKATLRAIYDLDLARAELLAAQHGASAFDDIDDFLNGIDAVIIAAPASSHFNLAEQALRAGRHVFVEKPLAMTLNEADALIALAGKRDLVLQVGHQERYVFEAAGMLARPAPPIRIECKRCAPPTGRGMDVSAIFDLMIHDLDLLRQLTRSKIAHLKVTGDSDEVHAELVLENGVVAVMEASRRAASLTRTMSLTYSDGVIDFDFVNRKTVNTTPTGLCVELDAADAPYALRDPLGFGANGFIDAIMGGVDPVVTGQHGRAAIEWALMIEDALALTGAAKTAPQTEERLRA